MATKAQIELTATDKTRQAFAQVERNFSGLQRSADGFARIAGGLGGVLSAGALVGFARSAISSAAALDDMAEATGASVEGLSKLTDIARIGGGDIGQVETALVRLTKALSGTDDESKGAGAAFAALGLSMAQLKQQAPDKALEDIAKAFARFEDGAGKTSAALAIFGKSGAQLLPLLKDIAEQSDRVASLTGDQAAAAEKLEKRWNALGVSAANFGRSMVIDVLPGLTQMLDQMQEGIRIAGGFGNAIRLFGIQQAPGRPGENIAALRAEIEKLQSTPGLLVPGLGKEQKLQDLRLRLEFEKFRQRQEALQSIEGLGLGNEGRLPLLPFIASTTTAPASGRTGRQAAERFPPDGRFPQLVTGPDSIASIEADLLLEQSEAVAKLVERYSDLADPLEKYRQELAEIQRLQESGALTGEKAAAASAAVTEQMTREMERQKKEVEETDKLGKELGMTFSSAFEDAIAGGKGLRDILSGIEQDLIRIITRKLVTEPIGNAISGALGGVASSGLGGVFDKVFGGLAVSILGAKDGGIFPGGFQAFEAGGVVRRPTLGLVGEGAFSEAIVPLPNGRAIPVEMRGGGATVVMNITTPDVSGFRASQGQILADAQRALARGRRNL